MDVREPKPTKLLVQKDPGPISGGGNGANSIGTGKTIPVYTVNANPMNDNFIATAGRDPHVRIYDRRFASEENNQPVKKFCPHNLVSINIEYLSIYHYKKVLLTHIYLLFYLISFIGSYFQDEQRNEGKHNLCCLELQRI